MQLYHACILGLCMLPDASRCFCYSYILIATLDYFNMCLCVFMLAIRTALDMSCACPTASKKMLYPGTLLSIPTTLAVSCTAMMQFMLLRLHITKHSDKLHRTCLSHTCVYPPFDILALLYMNELHIVDLPTTTAGGGNQGTPHFDRRSR